MNSREDEEELDARPVKGFVEVVHLSERQKKALWAVAMDWINASASGKHGEWSQYIGDANYMPEIIHLRDQGLIENGLSLGPKEDPTLKGAKWVLTKKGRRSLD